MSELVLILAFRLFDNFSNLFPKYFELLSFLLKKKNLLSMCIHVMHAGTGWHAYCVISTHCFYLKTCEVWPANMIVFVFLQTSCVFFSVDLFCMSLACFCVCLFLFYIGRT